MSKKYSIVGLVLAIFIIALFVRVYKITSIPPGLYPDEAMNGVNALDAIHSGNYKVFYIDNNGREGLFINIQSIAIRLFGNVPWALRSVSTVFGSLTVLGVFLLAYVLFKKPRMGNFSDSGWLVSAYRQAGVGASEKFPIRGFVNFPLLVGIFSALFMTFGFWHLNFSRMGFRAISVPFYIVWGLLFLYLALQKIVESKSSSAPPTRQSSDIQNSMPKILGWLSLLAAGAFFGLGFHSYISFRFAPFIIVLIFALTYFLFTKKKQWLEPISEIPFRLEITESPLQTPHRSLQYSRYSSSRFDVFAGDSVISSRKAFLRWVLFWIIFIVGFLITVSPIAFYYLKNPADFFGRASQVSIFQASHPILELAKSTVLTLGMFNVYGDCNARHNDPCAPELNYIVGVFFLIGIIILLRSLVKKSGIFEEKIISSTILGGFLIMLIPGFLSAEGVPHALRVIGAAPFVYILAGVGAASIYSIFAGRRKIQFGLLLIILIALAWDPYRYFIIHARAQDTKFAFNQNYVEQAEYLKRFSGFHKYIITNAGGTIAQEIPMPAMTSKYLLWNEFHNGMLEYISSSSIDTFTVQSPAVIETVEPDDAIMQRLKMRFTDGNAQGVQSPLRNFEVFVVK